jgi:hypothetical protein
LNEDLKLLIDFVSGKINVEVFEAQLYASDTIENYLSNDPTLPAYSYIGGDNYQFLISLDYKDPGDILNAQGAIEEFLDRKGIEYKSNPESRDTYDLILKAQLDWLDIDSKYISEKYLPALEGMDKTEAINKLKSNILNDFKYVNEPPKWMQSPCWPISRGKPLVFLGQVDVENYFHDVGAAYVFYDPENDSTETVIQVS